jgi:hypothetical protein
VGKVYILIQNGIVGGHRLVQSKTERLDIGPPASFVRFGQI